MADVIEFKRPKEESSDPHLSGEAICTSCRHEWVAVAPVGVDDMECPACGTMRGRYKYSIGPPEGASVWVCSRCTNNPLAHFLVYRSGIDGVKRICCSGCGTITDLITVFDDGDI